MNVPSNQRPSRRRSINVSGELVVWQISAEDSTMQWTIGKKLYSCLGLMAIAVTSMIAGGMYSQRQIGQNVEELSKTVTPNLQRAEEMVFRRRYSSTNDTTSSWRPAQWRGTGRIARSWETGIMNRRNARTPDPRGQGSCKSAVAAMNDFDAKCRSCHLSAAFKAPEMLR